MVSSGSFSSGISVKFAAICGGLSNSELFIQTHADVLAIPIVKPDEGESVLLGSSMLGAAAFYEEPLDQILSRFQGGGRTFHPREEVREFHEKKYQVFSAIGVDQMKYKQIMM